MGNYIYEVIKIKYVREGYLPDLPYHLISDNELYDAFLSYNSDSQSYSGYFTHIYTAPIDTSLLDKYTTLIEAIYRHLCIAKGLADHTLIEYGSNDEISIKDEYLVSSGMVKALNPNREIAVDNYEFVGLPDWIYAYMLGNVISNNSDDEMDYADLLKSFNTESYDIMQQQCYIVSSGWIQKMPESYLVYHQSDNHPVILRPATIFGEPHIIKAIRVEEASRGIV